MVVVGRLLEMVVNAAFSSFSFLLLSVWKTKSTNISRMFYLEISQPSLGVLHAASQGSPMTRLANAARDGTQV